MPFLSSISRTMPPPLATQVRGSSAMCTGKPVSSDIRRSISFNKRRRRLNRCRGWQHRIQVQAGFVPRHFPGADYADKGSLKASRISLLFSEKLRGTPLPDCGL